MRVKFLKRLRKRFSWQYNSQQVMILIDRQKMDYHIFNDGYLIKEYGDCIEGKTMDNLNEILITIYGESTENVKKKLHYIHLIWFMYRQLGISYKLQLIKKYESKIERGIDIKLLKIWV